MFNDRQVKKFTKYDTTEQTYQNVEYYSNGNLKYNFNYNFWSARSNKVQFKANKIYEAYHNNGKIIFSFKTNDKRKPIDEKILVFNEKGDVVRTAYLSKKNLKLINKRFGWSLNTELFNFITTGKNSFGWSLE